MIICGVGHLRVVEHLLLKCGELLAAVPVCVVAALDYLEMRLAIPKKLWLCSADQTSVAVQEWPVMLTICVFQDAVYPHMYSGNRLETYVDTPAVVCALKVDELVHRSVQQPQDHIAVLEQQVSVQHNWVHHNAELFVIIVREDSLVVATEATLTVAVVFPACYTGAVIQDLEDLAGRINS